MLTASAAARGRRLQTKAQQGRPTDKIERLLPAGGTTVEAPDRTAYAPGTAGTKRWAEDTRSATDGFALSKRQRSTAIEHVNYMSGWSRLLEKQGFGKYVEVCGAEVKNCLSDGKRGLRPVMEKATKGARKKTPKVMLPEMILAHLADMLSGKAKKNPGVAMRAAKAGEKEQPKARKGKKVVATVSAPGEFGHGAFKNEPWGLQSYEKRVYAVREFYKATLRGETADNPADDERVKGMLSSIVRVVGKKGRHVPEALSRAQVGAMAGAVDCNNAKMLLVAAYAAKNLVDGNRAAQEYLLNNGDVTREVNAEEFLSENALTVPTR